MMNTTKPIVPLDTKFSVIDCQKAFNGLSNREKLYAFYFTRASWEGAKICYFQRSYESPALFYIILKAFELESPLDFYTRAQQQLGQEVLDKAFIFIANFLGNCGNYKSFGDSKFVPDIDSSQLENLFLMSLYWRDH